MGKDFGLGEAKDKAEKKADSYLGQAIDSLETGPKVDKILTDVKNSSNTTAIIAGTAIGVILVGVLAAYFVID